MCWPAESDYVGANPTGRFFMKNFTYQEFCDIITEKTPGWTHTEKEKTEYKEWAFSYNVGIMSHKDKPYAYYKYFYIYQSKEILSYTVTVKRVKKVQITEYKWVYMTDDEVDIQEQHNTQRLQS